MSLTPGMRLGPYEITASIGKGGMGEVYHASDTNLRRHVAIKVLPEAFAQDPERLARFEREAQTLASLNHPNIATIHGLEKANGIRALVMELVDGPTLADRIEQGPIPLDEAVPITRQIAEALEAAHEQGIVHRDLKPSNIKVRPDGTVKVLDFGLAKALEQPTGAMSSSHSMSPTITTPAMTQMGMVLGTAAYMAPEQARGKLVDRRADIWAFGCVLYEMLSGRRAFEDEDISDTIASVLKNEPDWSLIPADVPAPVVALAKGCLVKDERQRVSNISTAKFILKELSASGAMQRAPITPLAETTSGPRWKNAIPVAIAAAMGSVIVGAGIWMLRPTPRPPEVARFSFTPEGPFTGTVHHIVAISPDGTRMAYTANGRIYVRALGELESRPVTDPETPAMSPVFAPDGNSIAFVTAGAALRRIPFSGGTASTIATFEGITNFSGLSWGRDDILIGVVAGGGILRVTPGGGSPQRIVSVASNEIAHAPRMLPDGQTVVFTLASDAGDDRWERAQIVAESLVDGSRRILIEGGSDARYVETGHLLYAVGGAMYAVPFDPKTLAVTGAAVPVSWAFEGQPAAPTAALNWRSRKPARLCTSPARLLRSPARAVLKLATVMIIRRR